MIASIKERQGRGTLRLQGLHVNLNVASDTWNMPCLVTQIMVYNKDRNVKTVPRFLLSILLTGKALHSDDKSNMCDVT